MEVEDHVLREEDLLRRPHPVTDLAVPNTPQGEPLGSVGIVTNTTLTPFLNAPTATLSTTNLKVTATITAQPKVVVIETEGVTITTNK